MHTLIAPKSKGSSIGIEESELCCSEGFDTASLIDTAFKAEMGAVEIKGNEIQHWQGNSLSELASSQKFTQESLLEPKNRALICSR